VKILIKHGFLVDPTQKLNKEVLDVLVRDGLISQIAKNIEAEADIIIDATGKIVMPGLVDMHVHLREPGREDKETVASGTKAALKGGVTSVLAMPNTFPSIDSIESVEVLRKIIKKTANCNVFIAAAITKGRLGKVVTDIPALKKCMVAAISDDGASVDDKAVFLEALKQAKQEKLLVICHCEDKMLSNYGVINLGFMSTKLGLRGISRESEYKRVERDIELAKEADAVVHIAHVSCKESVGIIAEAKKKGIRVTAETAAHYFSLTQENVSGYDTNMKMNPPLREEKDVEAIKLGLKSGVIDAIASDHAPHTENEKEIEFDRAEFGVIGLETELAASITELVQSGLLGWGELVEKLSVNPAKILGIDKGTLRVGKAADIVIVNPDKEWVVRKEGFVSQSVNSAFIGRKLRGVVEYTLCGGEIAYKNED